MKIGKSYPYFFNFLNEEFGDLKILRCFQLQMPVKEITFSSKDRKHYSFGEVESFILEAVHKLGRVTIEELNYIFHLGRKYIERILQDFLELKILTEKHEYYTYTDTGREAIDYAKKEEIINGQHIIMFDIFKGTYKSIIPVEKDRYMRSRHNYY